MAAADDLMRTKGLDQATDVIIGGSSAGGMIYPFSTSPLSLPSSPTFRLPHHHHLPALTFILKDLLRTYTWTTGLR